MVLLAENKLLHPILRALQFIFAVIVMGTTSYGPSPPTHPLPSPH